MGSDEIGRRKAGVGQMKDEPSLTALMVNRLIADLDNGFVHRTKPLRLTFQKFEGSHGWIPMLVCDFCGSGPITSLDGDNCCDFVPHESIKRPWTK